MVTSVNATISGRVGTDGTALILVNPNLAGKFASIMASLLHFSNSTATGAPIPLGNPTWVFLIGSTQLTPVDATIGPQVDLGPRIARSNDQVAIAVSGGTPGAQIQGLLHGSTSDDEHEVLFSNYVNCSGGSGMDNAGSPRSSLLGSIANTGNGDIKTSTFQIPANAQGCGFAVNFNSPNVAAAKITVVGNVTGIIYVDNEQNAQNQLIVTGSWANELFPEDTALICTCTGAAVASPSLTYFHAYSYNPRVRIGSQNYATPVYVRNADTIPAIWQKATAIVGFGLALANGATSNIAPATAGLMVYLFGASIAVQGTLNANFGQLEDTNQNTILSLNGSQNQYLTAGAAPMPGGIGVGMQIRCTAAGGMSVNGGVSYSLGTPV